MSWDVVKLKYCTNLRCISITPQTEWQWNTRARFVMSFLRFSPVSVKLAWLIWPGYISLALSFLYSRVQPTHFHLSLLLPSGIQSLSPALMCGNNIDPQPGRRRPAHRLYCFLLMMPFMAGGTSCYDVNKDPRRESVWHAGDEKHLCSSCRCVLFSPGMEALGNKLKLMYFAKLFWTRVVMQCLGAKVFSSWTLQSFKLMANLCHDRKPILVKD